MNGMFHLNMHLMKTCLMAHTAPDEDTLMQNACDANTPDEHTDELSMLYLPLVVPH
jgi:hypothetical protein